MEPLVPLPVNPEIPSTVSAVDDIVALTEVAVVSDSIPLTEAAQTAVDPSPSVSIDPPPSAPATAPELPSLASAVPAIAAVTIAPATPSIVSAPSVKVPRLVKPVIVPTRITTTVVSKPLIKPGTSTSPSGVRMIASASTSTVLPKTVNVLKLATGVAKPPALGPFRGAPGVARVTPVPTALASSGGGAVRPGLTTKVLNLTGGTFPPNYKLSPMTFNLGTSAAGKTGVVPLVLAGTSQPSTISFVRLQPPKPTTVTAGTSNPAAAVAEAARKRARLDLPSVSTGNGSGSSASNLLALKRRRRTTEDGVKGLRYFATKVCDKVKERNLTTYSAVAEDLVQEYSDPNPTKSREEIACEQKNIRRRVYDALNVLMAINVIQKERKQIRWVGLPRTLSEAGKRKDSLAERRKSLSNLRQRLFHSSLQLIALKELIEDNKAKKAAEMEKIKKVHKNASMSYISSVMEVDETQHIHLPFLLLTCGSNCEIECSVSSDAKDYQLRFSEPFKIMEDTEVLRHIPLVQSLDRGPFDLDHINRAMKQLPDFMQGRFVGLLQEHKERQEILQETKKSDAAAKAALAAEQVRMEKEMMRIRDVLAAHMLIAPAPTVETQEESFDPPAIATLETGSPVPLKPGYYMQISSGEAVPPTGPLTAESVPEPELMVKMEEMNQSEMKREQDLPA